MHLEAAAARHLSASGIEIAVPMLVPTTDGHELAPIETPDDGVRFARLFEFVAGTAWDELIEHPSVLLENLGRCLGHGVSALSDFTHAAASRTHQWDLTNAGPHRSLIAMIEDRDQRAKVEWLFHLWAAGAKRRLHQCPHSFIHGDANHENVLVEGSRVVGLLDFGDALINPVVCELAIALAYVMMHEDDPLAAGARVVGGFHSVRPLQRVELEVLFPLICGRLATSVAIAARRRNEDSERESWFITELPAWSLIDRISHTDPTVAGRTLAAETSIDVFNDYRGAPVNELMRARRERLGEMMSVAYHEPIKMTQGRGQYLFDDSGRPFLDLVNNVCHVGHCHPHVVEAGQRQLARLNTNTRYLYDGLTA
jgi:Ser/Thr protein kinase RdoA (MazF antagonist)